LSINKGRYLVRKGCRPFHTTEAPLYGNHSGDTLAAVSCGKGPGGVDRLL